MRVWVVQRSFLLVLFATGVPAAQEVPRTVWDGVFTETQAARGAVIYRQACRKCHYADLSGANASRARFLEADLSGAKLAGTDLRGAELIL